MSQKIVTWDDCQPLTEDWNSLKAAHAVGLFRRHHDSEFPLCQAYNANGEDLGLFNCRRLIGRDVPLSDVLLADEMGQLFLSNRLPKQKIALGRGTGIGSRLKWLPSTNVRFVAVAFGVKELVACYAWSQLMDTLVDFQGNVPVLAVMDWQALSDVEWRQLKIVVGRQSHVTKVEQFTFPTKVSAVVHNWQGAIQLWNELKYQIKEEQRDEKVRMDQGPTGHQRPSFRSPKDQLDLGSVPEPEDPGDD